MEASSQWSIAQEVHVWFVRLAAKDAAVEGCHRMLSDDEKDRASAYRLERLKTDYVLGRAVLRMLLGKYLAILPERVRFAYGPKGRPRLDFPESHIDFNLAHSGSFAAYAFVTDCTPGIDIEEVRPMAHMESLVSHAFSPEERQAWWALEASQREEGFFRCWTRKEAYIKALGSGLSTPLDRFCVDLRPESPAALVYGVDADSAVSQWQFHTFRPAPEYLASLALPEPRPIAVHPQCDAGDVHALTAENPAEG